MAPLQEEQVCNAFFCCYDACNFQDLKICCVSEGDCLCFTHRACFAAGESMLGPGFITDDSKYECCHCGLGCCSFGLKSPQVCCKSFHQCICYLTRYSIPFDRDFVPGIVLGILCFQCCPNVGCCKPATKVGTTGGAPSVLDMDR